MVGYGRVHYFPFSDLTHADLANWKEHRARTESLGEVHWLEKKGKDQVTPSSLSPMWRT